MTVWIAVECPKCYSTDVSKNGKSAQGKQRYLCKNSECPYRTFILDHSYPGRTRQVKQQIIEMSLNGSGVRDISRVLKVGAPTVIRELKKKKSQLKPINQKVLENLKPEQVEVEIQKVEEDEEQGEKNSEAGVEESELDEMWSFVRSKKTPRWLWHGIDRKTGKVLAYAFGRRQDEVLCHLKKLLEPFGVQKYCTDGYGSYERNLPQDKHEIGKRKTQRIERKHLRLRTRIKRLQRKTICFSKTEEMHDIVIGLFINRYEFGIAI
jgi:IS1 family transposase/transposase-like protein